MRDANNIFILKDELLYSNLFGDKTSVVFTTNIGGRSKGEFSTFNLAYQVGDEYEIVRENRKILAKKLKISEKNFIFANQTHSSNMQEVTEKDLGRGILNFNDGITNSDCLYTKEKNTLLCCFYADCTPIYFKYKNIIGVIHAGWQGTLKLITKKVIQHLVKYENVKVDEIKIIFGPSIKKDSFEIKNDVLKLIEEHKNLDLKNILFEKKNSYYADIVEFNKQILKNEGVLEENIHITSLDTYKEKELFSYRRNNITGRMLAIIYQK